MTGSPELEPMGRWPGAIDVAARCSVLHQTVEDLLANAPADRATLEWLAGELAELANAAEQVVVSQTRRDLGL
jgi:hypothetical protein